MPKKTVTLPVVPPLWYQLPSWVAYDKGIRRKLTSYPRRHGKDFEDLSIFSRECVMNRGTYYYVFPTRRWGERAIWETMSTINGVTKPIIEWMFPDEFCKRFVSDLRVEVQGRYGVSKFFMGGTDNLDFVGQGGQGYGMSEFSLHKEEVTGLLAPIIRQSQAMLFLNGTMRGKRNPLYKILQNTKGDPEWHSRWLTPEDTKLYCWINKEEGINVNPELEPLIGKINPRTGELYKNVQGVPFYNIQSDINSGMISYSLARQEYLNRADGEIAGGYYGYELRTMKEEGRFRRIDPRSDLVYTFWDLGGAKEATDKTTITFAHYNSANKTFRVVDYYENSGKLRGHYWDVVASMNYDYGGHYYPHDGKRTNEWTGETSADTALNEFGVEIRFIPKTSKTANDIEIVRRGFKKTEFDSDRCDELVDYLGLYHPNEATGAPCHKENCRICHGASHAADGFRYMHMAGHLDLIEPYLQTQPKKYSWMRPQKDESVLSEDSFLV